MHKITTKVEKEYNSSNLLVKETTVVTHQDALDLMGKEYEETEAKPCNDDAYAMAMKIVINELKREKSPGSNYYAWQSNIAMAIEDTFPQHWQAFSDLQIPKMANDAAKIFLENLIR